MTESALARYRPAHTYQWNYDHAPDQASVNVPALRGEYHFCGLPVGSPLGMPAGPLLNGRWCLYYASLGFDVLTYKTVRSVPRACYEPPNLQPVLCGQLRGDECSVPVQEGPARSWAVSFGMPSKAPEVWRADISAPRTALPQGKVLSVSVVGTVEESWTIEDLARDYAQCAKWAVDSGADCIETNFSCPNVATVDGQLYQQPDSAARLAAAVRDAIGDTPLIIKVGQISDEEAGESLLTAVAPHVDGLAMTNSVATAVSAPDGDLLFGGQRRGICGEAIRDASIDQTAMMARLAATIGRRISIIGVGGAFNHDDVRRYLEVGASAVHLATAAMLDPLVGVKIREEMSKRGK